MTSLSWLGQSVEYETGNAKVVSSTPAVGNIFNPKMWVRYNFGHLFTLYNLKVRDVEKPSRPNRAIGRTRAARDMGLGSMRCWLVVT